MITLIVVLLVGVVVIAVAYQLGAALGVRPYSRLAHRDELQHMLENLETDYRIRAATVDAELEIRGWPRPTLELTDEPLVHRPHPVRRRRRPGSS